MTITYPYLPEGRSIQYVPAENIFMAEAKNVRDTLSTDRLHSTSAVVVKDNKVIGRGANQSLLKTKFLADFHRNVFCVRRLFKIRSGEKYWLCPGCSSCRHHAEAQAVKDALAKADSISGADLYLYGHWWCCKPCWDTMIAAGISKVYLVNDASNLFRK